MKPPPVPAKALPVLGASAGLPVLGSAAALPVLDSAAPESASCAVPTLPAPASTSWQRLPPWLKRNVPKGSGNHFTANLLDELRLETVCESAKCPNRMEC